MDDLKFTVSTDTEHVITLDSHLIYANWKHAVAYAGQEARFEIGTSFVGQGAKIIIKGRTASGDKLGKIKDVIRNNKYVGAFQIPEDTELDDEIYFTVKLPKNDLEGESNRIPVFPPVVVANLKWSAAEARRGDVLTLTADINGLRSGTEVLISIYEHDAERAHEPIAQIPAIVKESRIEIEWEYEYHEHTRDIPTENEMQDVSQKQHYAHPEYFFVVSVGDTEFGKDRQSGLLRFMDVFNFEVTNEDGSPAAKQEYVLHLADGSKQKGTLDKDGKASEEDLPPGEVEVGYSDDEDDAKADEDTDDDDDAEIIDEDDEWIDEFQFESELDEL